MAYSKLHSSLVNSSLWCERDDVRILFITMLALCDREGYVYGSRSGIFRQANLAQREGTDPFDILLSPDDDSSDLMRNPENEGRRIEEIPGGFRLLNYGYYRGLRDDDDRREQNKQAQARFRAKNKPQSARISRGKPPSAHAEAEADTEAKKQKKKDNPSQREIEDFCESISLPRSDGEAMFLNWEERKWPKSWQLTIRKWKSFGYMPSQKNGKRQIVAAKLPAPYYPKAPPKREVTETELAKQREIIRETTDKLREQFKMP